MPLWAEIVTPVEATNIFRGEIQAQEMAKGSLSEYLPNVMVDDDHVKFYIGDHGLVEEAFYRSFDAEPELIGHEGLQSALVELPSLSAKSVIDERTQKALRRLPDDVIRRSIVATIQRLAASVADANERTRGTVLHMGKAFRQQHNYMLNDDFGRAPELSFTAAQLWSDPAVDRLDQIGQWLDLYGQFNAGQWPGSILMTKKAWAAFSKGTQFNYALGGIPHTASKAEIDSTVAAQGFPDVRVYNRSTRSGPVLPDGYVYFLPAPTAINNPNGTALGATFWGRTVSADIPEFGILPGSEPGAVVGVHRKEQMPYTVEVEADVISLPVARDANKAMVVKVL